MLNELSSQTLRHLDKLRWQMLQLLIAVASAAALVLRSTSGAIEWWFYSLLGFSLLVIASVMLKIGSGIRRNAEVLKTAAEKIGDSGIPDIANKWLSISHWLTLSVMSIGGVIFAWPLIAAFIC